MSENADSPRDRFYLLEGDSELVDMARNFLGLQFDTGAKVAVLLVKGDPELFLKLLPRDYAEYTKSLRGRIFLALTGADKKQEAAQDRGMIFPGGIGYMMHDNEGEMIVTSILGKDEANINPQVLAALHNNDFSVLKSCVVGSAE